MSSSPTMEDEDEDGEDGEDGEDDDDDDDDDDDMNHPYPAGPSRPLVFVRHPVPSSNGA